MSAVSDSSLTSGCWVGEFYFTHRELTDQACACIPLCSVAPLDLEHSVQDTNSGEKPRKIRIPSPDPVSASFPTERRSSVMGGTQHGAISLSQPLAPPCHHDPGSERRCRARREGSWDPHRAGQPGHLSQASHSSDSAEAMPGSGWASWAGLPGRRDFPAAQVLRLLSWSPGRA